MRYKTQNYVVEVHIGGTDVFSKDYGPEQGCAMRALERLKQACERGEAKMDEIRLWHAGRCIMSKNMRS